MSTPLITIFVRHSVGCKYKGDEFSKRCQCPKHLRWTQSGKQYRKASGGRSWAEAETAKRALEDQLAGRTPEAKTEGRYLQESIDLFIQDKKVQGVTPDVLAKYARELDRLREYCERNAVYTVPGITRELLTGYCATWETLYPSSQTRAMVAARCRGFLRYCYEAQWILRVPPFPKIRVEVVPTMPLSGEEYARLLEATKTFLRGDRVRALFQLMRYSGLAIRDALTLARAEIQHDGKDLYRITTARQKTGTHVSVPIPADVAREVLAVKNDNPMYIFWDGESDITKSWTKYVVAPVFKKAELERGGNMMSHRLRDTFAVDLLERGVPLEEVSKLLGHESIKTTEKSYAKWVKGRQDRLDALVRGTWKGTNDKSGSNSGTNKDSENVGIG